jgi:8-oxo-dGTP diphosphatase
MGERGAVRDRQGAVRRVHFHDPEAPIATVVAPSVFTAVRDDDGRVLLVRRCDSGTWELPGGRVDVGESAPAAAVRETAEESGLHVRITGFVGLFTDPAHVVESALGGEIRQQFVVCFHGCATGGTLRPDFVETSDACWFEPRHVETLPLEPSALMLIHHALSAASQPFLG